MNLVVDVGNTSLKMALFEAGKLVVWQKTDVGSFLGVVRAWFARYPQIGHAMVASVGGLGQNPIKALSLYCTVHQLGHGSKIPFTNSYQSPKTLGADRIALVAGALFKYPKTNVLIIDAGTCITYDFIDAHGNYLGGSISPGVNMRYNAMHQYTAKLPLLQPKPLTDFLGTTTENAMHTGVLFGIVGEIDGFIYRYNQDYDQITVVFTGGDADFFTGWLKTRGRKHPELLLEGLNYLLELNK